ncbi:LON peptidase substrate-binding domain-containing protein [Terricaulis sp.]|uniref:LON peptidase substrate-binding domain-containing protein n=1 Tax=Terricaulis sp. TaxID=2768686 RepID=UPI003785068A
MSAFGYRKPADLPQTVALFPLSGAILFPRGVLALNVFEPRYLNMVDDALGAERLIAVIQPATGEENEAIPALCNVGTIGRITTFSETDDGRYLITLTGVCRFDLEQEIKSGTPYRQALVSYDEYAADFSASPGVGIDRAGLIASLKDYARSRGYAVDWEAVDQAPIETVVNVASQVCPFDPAAKQALLEAPTLEDRSSALIALVEWGSAGDSERPLQ